MDVKARIFAQRMTRKGVIFPHKAFIARVLKRDLLRYPKTDLGKLSPKQKARWIANVYFGVPTLMSLKRGSLNISVVVHRVEGDIHVPLKDSLALDVAKVHGGRVARIHIHVRPLQTLTSKDLDGCGLSNFPGSIQNLLTVIVECFNLDSHVAITHTRMTDFHIQLIPRQNHADERDVASKRPL